MTLPVDDEDDGLPVLTQVLRTGDGRLPPSVRDTTRARGATPPEGDEAGDPTGEPAGADGDETPAWPRALVIGSDPDSDDGGPIDVWRDAASIRRAAARQSDDAGAGGDDGRTAAHDAPAWSHAADRHLDVASHDVFLRTAPIDALFDDRLDEPPLIDRGDRPDDADEDRLDDPTSATASGAISRDIALVFDDRPAQRTRDDDARLAAEVRDRVLQELSARIDTELDARIAQTLHAALETALAGLQGSLRVELAEALRDVVGRAVDDAVRRHRDRPRDDAS